MRNYIGEIDPLQRYYDNIGRKSDINTYVRTNFDINSDLSAFVDLQYRHIHYTIKGESDNYDWNIGGSGGA